MHSTVQAAATYVKELAMSVLLLPLEGWRVGRRLQGAVRRRIMTFVTDTVVALAWLVSLTGSRSAQPILGLPGAILREIGSYLPLVTRFFLWRVLSKRTTLREVWLPLCNVRRHSRLGY
jgi:hypothetical protein